MCKNKILEKLLAIILIFTLTFAKFAFVTECFAGSIFDTIFGSDSDTGSENVEFEAYFGTGESMSTSVISDVNNEELTVNIDLSVGDEGYLKDATVEVLESEEGNGLNFTFGEITELSEYVQSFEDNTLTFRQLNTLNQVSLNLPIKYESEEYINEEKLSKDFLVRFTGIYVDEEGEEEEVSKDVILNLSWKDEREVSVNSEATKYIDFGAGVILQTKVTVDSTTENNSLPAKQTETVIKVPSLNGVYPSNVTIVADSTAGTNGKSYGNVEFNENNWNYNEEEKTLTITVENTKQLVEVNTNSDEYLKEDTEPVEEERYYSKSGVDEYVVTYTYENTSLSEGTTISSEISTTLTKISGVEDEEYKTVSTKSNIEEYVLEGQTGNIVSLNIQNETQDVSKAYMYVNYDHNDKYEIEYETETVINVSYKDIVGEIFVEDVDTFYNTKDGENISTEDIYYKKLVISKDNFLSILGENGEISITNIDGTEIAKINNETEVNEENNIIINLSEKYTKLKFNISAPVAEGNLVISKTKAFANATIDKETLKNVSSIKSTEKVSANYTYVENTVEIETVETSVGLKDTQTKANLSIDRDSLSTLAMNNNVELRVELNNATDESDVYSHSTFTVELPEYIETLEVTDASIVYGEGLNITSVEVNGRTIYITLDGVQDGINSGVLTNGTNIILNTNIKVDLYTPAKSEAIKLSYSNDSATNYADNGYSELEVAYSAPVGLVTVNSTSNYNNVGSVLTSVRQGEQEDLIDIYSEAKQATMEIVVMNNNGNAVTDVAILGRIPFEGVTDIATGEDLGTTVTTKLVSGITSDEHNSTVFSIYYSENENATKDLNDSSNGWTMSPESLDNIKSYLILPQDENYEMADAEILRFTYEYEIPANLPHNEEIYGTFLAYFTNLSEVATTSETSTPDKVGLSTGEGPELTISLSTDVESVKEKEEVKVTVNITNVGDEKAQDIESNISIPTYASYSDLISDNDITGELTDSNLKITASEIESGATITYTVVFVAKGIPTIEQYYKNIDGFMKLADGSYVIRTYSANEEDLGETEEEITYEDKVITTVPTIYLDFTSTVTAKDLGTTISSETKNVELKEAEFYMVGYVKDEANLDGAQDIGTEIDLGINIQNISSSTKTNVVITETLPSELTFISGEISDASDNKIADAVFDSNTNTITWNAGSMVSGTYYKITYKVEVVSLADGVAESKVELNSSVTADGTNAYGSSNTISFTVGRAILTISQTTLTTNTYVTEGDSISYVFTVKNEGAVKAKSLKLTDVIPDGLTVRKISYIIDGLTTTKKVTSSTQATVDLTLNAGSEAVVTVEALAGSLNGVQEKTVTNTATVVASNVTEQTTNSITHIIEADQNKANNVVESSTSTINSSTSSNITKTYKISGIAWLDSNQNGMRDSGEEILPGISVKLINSETGVITKSVTTDSSGTYTFSGIANGNYLVLFDYDTITYTVTTYQKTDVASNVNSDAIVTQIEQDGKVRNGAVTDVITVADGSISNIDIGLILADTFDLSLSKTITNVSIQTQNGTTTTDYDNVTLAKEEIAAKYLSGSTVYVEYTITVTNSGDIAGYAKKIIDYLPEGMTFNSGLTANSDWYTGTDGNLYSTSFSETQLVAGQSESIKLVLTKAMTEENTGVVSNQAEICEDYNIYGITDTNSTPGNKAQGENDLGTADVAILIKTGEVFIYTSVIITTILLGGIVIFISYNKIVLRRKKGGV